MIETVKIFGILYLFAAFIVWLGISLDMFRVVKLRKPGVSAWRGTLWNPFNLILMSSKLTEAGLKARNRLFILVIIFVAMCLIPVVGGILFRLIS